LLRATQQVERTLGRRRGLRNAPRTLDIDILLYGANIVSLPELEIPHPRISERRFVLVPLREIAPAQRHPTLRRTIAELLAETHDRSEVRRWQPSSGAQGAVADGAAVSPGEHAHGESA